MFSAFPAIGRSALLAALASLALAAEPPRLGLQALSSTPTGSMRSQFTDGSGYGMGAFAEWEVDMGKSIRLAYDGVFYPNQRGGSGLAGLPVDAAAIDTSRKFHSDALTLQYLIFPNQDNEGFYLMAGLGGQRCQTKTESSFQLFGVPVNNLTTLEETGTKLACMAGLGYEFNRNWGVSARYSFITVHNRTLGAAQAGISYRF